MFVVQGTGVGEGVAVGAAVGDGVANVWGVSATPEPP